MTDPIQSLDETLEKVYSTIATPATVAATLTLTVLTYVSSLPGSTSPLSGTISATDVISTYSLTLFFILLSLVSYLLSHVFPNTRFSIATRLFAVFDMLLALAYAAVVSGSWLKSGTFPTLSILEDIVLVAVICGLVVTSKKFKRPEPNGAIKS